MIRIEYTVYTRTIARWGNVCECIAALMAETFARALQRRLEATYDAQVEVEVARGPVCGYVARANSDIASEQQERASELLEWEAEIEDIAMTLWDEGLAYGEGVLCSRWWPEDIPDRGDGSPHTADCQR